MKKLQLVVAVLFVLMLGFGISQAQDYYGDARINQQAHMGGDALYCTAGIGCYVLDAGGNQLWDIAESAIDAMFAEACASQGSVIQDVGVGTYGMMTMEVTCFEGYDKTIEVCGFDEWGKNYCVEFAPTYNPVGGEAMPYCQMLGISFGKRIDKGGILLTPTAYNLYLRNAMNEPITLEVIATSPTPFEGVPFCSRAGILN